MEFKIKEYRARPHDLMGAWKIYQYNAEEDDWELVEEYKFIDDEDCDNQFYKALSGRQLLRKNNV